MRWSMCMLRASNRQPVTEMGKLRDQAQIKDSAPCLRPQRKKLQGTGVSKAMKQPGRCDRTTQLPKHKRPPGDPWSVLVPPASRSRQSSAVYLHNKAQPSVPVSTWASIPATIRRRRVPIPPRPIRRPRRPAIGWWPRLPVHGRWRWRRMWWAAKVWRRRPRGTGRRPSWRPQVRC
jgi:hypothetical protein